jgi:hypothetical protein
MSSMVTVDPGSKISRLSTIRGWQMEADDDVGVLGIDPRRR